MARAGPRKVRKCSLEFKLGPPGQVGHRGICNRELFISEVLTCERLPIPARLVMEGDQ